jgi:hypothetical protein
MLPRNAGQRMNRVSLTNHSAEGLIYQAMALRTPLQKACLCSTSKSVRADLNTQEHDVTQGTKARNNGRVQ